MLLVRPGGIVLDVRINPLWKGAQQSPTFAVYSQQASLCPYKPQPMSIVTKWLDGSLGMEVPYFPDYKSHLNISRTPLLLPKIWEKSINKSHLSISRTLFCYFLARRNVLGCTHVMRRSAKERQDAIGNWVHGVCAWSRKLCTWA